MKRWIGLVVTVAMIACAAAYASYTAYSGVNHSDPWIRFIDDDYTLTYSDGDFIVAEPTVLQTITVFLPTCDQNFDYIKFVKRGLGTFRLEPYGDEEIDGAAGYLSIVPTNQVLMLMCLYDGENPGHWTLFTGS